MKNYKNEIRIVFALIALIFSFSWYFINKTNGYEVCFNGKVVAYVKNINDFEKANKEVYKEIENRFLKIDYKDDVYLNKVLVDESCFTDKANLKKIILNSSCSEVEGIVMKNNKYKLGVVANKSEAQNIIKDIENYYISQCEFKDITDVKCRNNISYENVKLKISQVNNIEDIKSDIIDINKNSKNPIVSVDIIGNINKEEIISPSTVVAWSDSLSEGSKKIKSQGEPGRKIVKYKVTMENDIYKGKYKIEENVLKNPKDTVIVKGSKKSHNIVSNTLTLPSRGFISSGFGMRWGKMHNGIDIAADEGTPIYAVISGKVIYSSFEEGYGNLIKIDNGGGVETLYGHCSSMEVNVGENIRKGQMIGRVGSTGKSTGPHVHFEVRQNGKAKNPTEYLK